MHVRSVRPGAQRRGVGGGGFTKAAGHPPVLVASPLLVMLLERFLPVLGGCFVGFAVFTGFVVSHRTGSCVAGNHNNTGSEASQ